MSQIVLSPNNAGTAQYTIAAPATSTNRTLTLPDATTTLVGTDATQTLTNKTLTTPNIDSAQFATVYGTAPLYGCRAWVNFDGTTTGTFAGGVSTVTRVAGSTTATVTTTNPHGMITGNYVYAATGVVAGAYAVTVLTSTTFTITTVATTALTAASITFNVATIRAAGNVNSVAKNGAGDYTVNFTTAMPDANYAIIGTTNNYTVASGTSGAYVVEQDSTVAPTSSAVCIKVHRSTVAFVDNTLVCVSIFR